MRFSTTYPAPIGAKKNKPFLLPLALVLLLGGGDHGSEGFRPHSVATASSCSPAVGTGTAAAAAASAAVSRTTRKNYANRDASTSFVAPGRTGGRAGHFGYLPARRGLLCRGGGAAPGDPTTTRLLSTAKSDEDHDPTTTPPRALGRHLSFSSKSSARIASSRLRCGGNRESSSESSSSSLASASSSVRRFVTLSLAVALSSLAVYAVYQNRELLLNKERVQEETLRLLHRLNDGTTTPGRSLALYSVGMALWELCSLSTIPVETAAGMVFGWKAAPFSVLGKLMGAGTAFALGRTWLNKWATDRLAHNSVWKLVTTSKRFSPWSTAFLMKYSCFPEFVKNFGSSFLNVSPFQFAIATLIHGGTFTLLWTWWGVETTLKLQSPALHVASPGLKVALVVAGFVGIVATPALMTWWINSLRKEAIARKE